LQQNFFDSFVGEFYAFSFCWFAERVASSLLVEPINWGEFEQSLCVGFCFASLSDKLWKTGSHHGDGKLVLTDPVQCGYEAASCSGNVLEFVDSEYYSCSALGTSMADLA
jgi:hypothetical protein